MYIHTYIYIYIYTYMHHCHFFENKFKHPCSSTGKTVEGNHEM